jgi:hypothetical protein
MMILQKAGGYSCPKQIFHHRSQRTLILYTKSESLLGAGLPPARIAGGDKPLPYTKSEFVTGVGFICLR